MPSQTHINFFVTCTSTKRFLPTGNVLLRDVEIDSTSGRFSKWTSLIQKSRSGPTPAIETYLGGHWSIVRSMADAFRSSQTSVRLWIVSAGYGLISPSDLIIPYGATFAPAQRDSVSSAVGRAFLKSTVEWWNMLTKWLPPTVSPNSPRSVTEVVQQDPESTNLLVLPPDYFRALGDDLSESVKYMSDPCKMIVLSSDSKCSPELTGNLIKIDARLQKHLGGARASLGVRTARAIMQRVQYHSINISTARQVVAELISRHGVIANYDRKQVTDEQVGDFIFSELLEDRSMSYSRLLRQYRDAGFACEMKRFRGIFGKVKNKLIAKTHTISEYRD